MLTWHQVNIAWVSAAVTILYCMCTQSLLLENTNQNHIGVLSPCILNLTEAVYRWLPLAKYL